MATVSLKKAEIELLVELAYSRIVRHSDEIGALDERENLAAHDQAYVDELRSEQQILSNAAVKLQRASR